MNKILKHYIKHIIHEARCGCGKICEFDDKCKTKPCAQQVKENSHSNARAAGIVIFKDFDNIKKVLVLHSNKGPDLPKGRIQKNEQPFNCAIRETLEETGINDLSFVMGKRSIIIDKCQMYCATTNKEPILSKNPGTGKLEHYSYEWCEPHAAAQKLPSYLAKAVKWAINHIH